MKLQARRTLLYHFCRLQLPTVQLSREQFDGHLDRCLALHQQREPNDGIEPFLDRLYATDWYLCMGCLERSDAAWTRLFAARTGRSDCLLIDALRVRACRLFPRDDEKQESAIAEFWSHLLIADRPESPPVLARYDGQRPLVPWLIIVFQNWHISQLRGKVSAEPIVDSDRAPPAREVAQSRWHEAFCQAARESLENLSEADQLLLGLRLRYRLSQREVAQVLGVHEGTISRQTDKLRDRSLEHIQQRLLAQGWTGDDLQSLVLTEMAGVLLDEPLLSAERLAQLLAAKGKRLPG